MRKRRHTEAQIVAILKELKINQQGSVSISGLVHLADESIARGRFKLITLEVELSRLAEK